MSLEQALPIFAQGKAAFFIDVDAVYTSILDPKVSVVRDTIGFAPFPAGPAGARPPDVGRAPGRRHPGRPLLGMAGLPTTAPV